MRTQSTGLLAKTYCDVELPLQVLRSQALYYIGTLDSQGCPVSRESMEYYPSKADAESALIKGQWTQRLEP